jgi:hypothetical protein
METKPQTKTNATESGNENLTCWSTATNPQCLRVETASEIHLFPYGYFCRATLSRDGNKDTIEIQFQETMVVAKGKGLEPLCDALARLGVERIKIRPNKYEVVTTGCIVSDIEIRKVGKENQV